MGSTIQFVTHPWQLRAGAFFASLQPRCHFDRSSRKVSILAVLPAKNGGLKSTRGTNRAERGEEREREREREKMGVVVGGKTGGELDGERGVGMEEKEGGGGGLGRAVV